MFTEFVLMQQGPPVVSNHHSSSLMVLSDPVRSAPSSLCPPPVSLGGFQQVATATAPRPTNQGGLSVPVDVASESVPWSPLPMKRNDSRRSQCGWRGRLSTVEDSRVLVGSRSEEREEENNEDVEDDEDIEVATKKSLLGTNNARLYCR